MSLDIRILLDENGLLAVEKPAGFETIVKGTSGQCLTNHVRRHLGLKKLFPAHRLDRDTTGVQLFAKDKDTLKELEKIFRERQTEKSYLAICLGVPRNEQGVTRRNLSEWEGGRKPVRVVKGRGGLEAETSYRLIAASPKNLPETDSKASLILFTPHQGRTHQIRVHASALGYPVLGDDNYGDRPANLAVKRAFELKRQALHAWRFSADLPGLGETRLEAEIPEDMANLLDRTMPEDWRKRLP